MWNKIRCFLGRHDFFLLQQITERGQKLGCTHCNKRFAVLHDGRSMILPWDDSFTEFYKNVFGVEVEK